MSYHKELSAQAWEIVRTLDLRLVPERIASGCLYIAERNTGPHLLTCKDVRDGYVIPQEAAYAYELCDCVRVEERQ